MFSDDVECVTELEAEILENNREVKSKTLMRLFSM